MIVEIPQQLIDAIPSIVSYIGATIFYVFGIAIISRKDYSSSILFFALGVFLTILGLSISNVIEWKVVETRTLTNSTGFN